MSGDDKNREMSASTAPPSPGRNVSDQSLQSIPFERQRTERGKRCCAAAALTMVYRSFGLQSDQDSVWNDLQASEGGSDRTRTFRLAGHALRRGLASVPVRLKNFASELETLDAALDNGIRVVLNHRIRPDSPLGHFSVLVGVDPAGQTVWLHDPQFGPHRRLFRDELLRLWTPLNPSEGSGNEITGRIAVLFASESIGDEIRCPQCRNPWFFNPFQPLLASLSAVFCPWCDAGQYFLFN